MRQLLIRYKYRNTVIWRDLEPFGAIWSHLEQSGSIAIDWFHNLATTRTDGAELMDPVQLVESVRSQHAIIPFRVDGNEWWSPEQLHHHPTLKSDPNSSSIVIPWHEHGNSVDWPSDKGNKPPPPYPLPETHPSKPTNQPTHQKNRRQRRLRVIQTLPHTKISLNLSKRLTKSKHPKLKVRELKRSGGKKILIRVKNKTDRLGLIFFRLHPTDLLLKLSLYGNNSH